jgi:predicted ATPase/DNA-binding winged helix-turn-helix (wHTH) protein
MIKIGNLQVFIDRREIRSNGEIVRIGGRAFHILELLIKARGALVSKEEIMACVWPTTIVEENNLQVQIASIRRLLGEDRGLVVTVAGRGYHLSDVQTDYYGSPPAEPDTEAVSRNSSSHILVSNQSAFFGRTGAVLDVLAALCGSSIVTLVGSGGIGKTRLAVEVARFVHPNFFDSVAFISLAGVTDARFAVDAVADALGLRPSTEGVSLAHIAKAMTGKRTLMVLDNCEHLLDAASKIVEHLASDSEGVRILATSREPLRVREEVLYNVLPLEVPDVSKSSNEALQASAVQLFFSRAEGIDNNEEYNGRNISIAADVCRRLDGIPLAIELAASRASSLGLDVISARLDDRLNTLSGSPRTTLPRHQTLKAMLDWSYQLLDKTERLIFRWLGMFVDGFTFEAACRIGYINGLSDGEVMDSLSGLLSKSLVSRSERGRCSTSTRR